LDGGQGALGGEPGEAVWIGDPVGDWRFLVEDVADFCIPLHGLCTKGVTTDDDLVDVWTRVESAVAWGE